MSLDTFLQATASGLMLGALFALSALGLSLVLGVARTVNLVHGELVLLGAYAAWAIAGLTGLNPLLTAPAAALAVGVLAWPIERWLLRPLRGQGEAAPLLTTFALSIILRNLLVATAHGDTRALDSGLGERRVSLGPVTLSWPSLIGFVVALAAALGAHLLITRTGFGRQLRASAEDPAAAALVGAPVDRVRTLTYALAGVLSGLGGAMLGLVFSFTPASGVEFLLTGFAVVVLGGLGSVKGALAGGLLLGVAESLGAAALGDGWRLFIGLVGLLAFLAVRPQGLFGRTA